MQKRITQKKLATAETVPIQVPTLEEMFLQDEEILDLYWRRSDAAIAESDKKYGRYCHQIAYNILFNEEDSEECVNDTWLRAWEAIPPTRPSVLRAYFGRITRNLSLNRYEKNHADKRGGGQIPLALDELGDCLSEGESIHKQIDQHALAELLNRFLLDLKVEQRRIFVRRYWYLDSIAEIARKYGMSESKVKKTLSRTRIRLALLLEQEGYYHG